VSEAGQPTDPDQPEAAVIRQESLTRFEAMLAPLNDDQRDLLALRFVVGLPTREIVTIVGKSDGAVRAQLSRALKTLKEHHHAT
jgi:RNA polymerase sigma factor (sigma-70 family)